MRRVSCARCSLVFRFRSWERLVNEEDDYGHPRAWQALVDALKEPA